MTDELTVVEQLEALADAAMTDEMKMGLRTIIRQVTEAIDDDVRDCVHCGSLFTYRRSDGDIGCHDCHGIMPRQYRCDGCGQTGTKEELAKTTCSWYNDGTHDSYPDTRICPWCGEQGTPHELAQHTCTAGEVSHQ